MRGVETKETVIGLSGTAKWGVGAQGDLTFS